MAGDDFKDAFAISNVGGINPVDISPPPGFSATQPIPFATGRWDSVEPDAEPGLPAGSDADLHPGAA